jgi:ribosomal protein L23
VFDPHITEKSMALLQNANKVTVKVANDANKTRSKTAFQRSIPGQGRPRQHRQSAREREDPEAASIKAVSGYKKAIITLASGSAVDLFKE